MSTRTPKAKSTGKVRPPTDAQRAPQTVADLRRAHALLDRIGEALLAGDSQDVRATVADLRRDLGGLVKHSNTAGQCQHCGQSLGLADVPPSGDATSDNDATAITQAALGFWPFTIARTKIQAAVDAAIRRAGVSGLTTEYAAAMLRLLRADGAAIENLAGPYLLIHRGEKPDNTNLSDDVIANDDIPF